MLIKDRLKKDREHLDSALETLAMLCEPVEPPEGELEHIHYFCGNAEIPEDSAEREPRRAALYKTTVALVRAYANILLTNWKPQAMARPTSVASSRNLAAI